MTEPQTDLLLMQGNPFVVIRPTIPTRYQGLDKIKKTRNILTSIFERVLDNQNLTYFNAFCLLFMSFDMFI